MANKIALSPEEMQNLELLGIDTSSASMYWLELPEYKKLKPTGETVMTLFVGDEDIPSDAIRTFCSDDIFKMLPGLVCGSYTLFMNKVCRRFVIQYIDNRTRGIKFISTSCASLLEAAYHTLVWVIKYGHHSNEYLIQNPS